MNPEKILLNDINDLPAATQQLLNLFPDKRVFAFFGEMGSGKTTIIKELCKQLGVTDSVSSPTFALVYEYRTSNETPIYHFDLYRIKDEKEALDIGIEEYLYSGNYCFLEWPEKVIYLLPEETVHVRITNQTDPDVSGTNKRVIEIL